MRYVLWFKWTSDEIVSAFMHSFDGSFDIAVSRHHDDRRIIFSFSQLSQHVHAAQSGHHVIKNDQIRMKSFELFERLGAVLRHFYSIAGARQDLLDDSSVGRLVVNDQTIFAHGLR